MATPMGACIYPDWEGGHTVGDHVFDVDGYCIVCGYLKPIDPEQLPTQDEFEKAK